MIDIEHTQPWRGRIGLRFRPAGARRTRVQVRRASRSRASSGCCTDGDSRCPNPRTTGRYASA